MSVGGAEELLFMFSVLHAQFEGLEEVLGQLSTQDSVRLLNEFDERIDLIAKVSPTDV